jgi:hypothetical protein
VLVDKQSRGKRELGVLVGKQSRGQSELGVLVEKQSRVQSHLGCGLWKLSERQGRLDAGKGNACDHPGDFARSLKQLQVCKLAFAERYARERFSRCLGARWVRHWGCARFECCEPA